MPTNYWMIISNLENFRITRELGFKTQGLKTQHQRKVQRIEPGDRILLYVSGERAIRRHGHCDFQVLRGQVAYLEGRR